MGYENLGRKIGVGTRVAARLLQERAQNAGSSQTQSRPAAQNPAAQNNGRPDSPAQRPRPVIPRNIPAAPRAAATDVTRRVARGGAGFGRAFWAPFRHAMGALWHQITGVFFAIFALFFAQNLWRVRTHWRAGVEHRHFVVYLIFLLVFAYFSVTAFWTARRAPR